jgi:ribosomal protein S18 acetylase RimI-like enzyme
MKWMDEAEQVHPSEPHYYLPCVGVDPACQGSGFGSVILAHLALKADQDGVGCYLENADPRNLPFYQRFGFQVVLEKEVIGLPSWFMWREPK